jgi:hypothetical protein
MGEETQAYEGPAWYRKQFAIPGGTDKKYFLHFEGAMQVADVWVNGIKIGTHDNSGYTGFCFDITNQVTPGSTAICAVRLDNTANINIPPGRTRGDCDYFLYSGIYRDVWLVTTNKVHIPFCGQLVSTPQVSTTSGTIRARTTVRNEYTVAKNCTVVVSIRNQSGQEIASKSSSASIPAGGSYIFDMTSDPIANPRLWSPENPNLYHTYTSVSVEGSVADDYAATVGFRMMSWSNTNGFSLNGSRYEIRGVCLHQSFPWVGNAATASRWFPEIAMIKDAGFNLVRCSHYPRDPAFYDVCDSMGIMLQVEVPTWGYGQSSYSAAFWTRLNNCASEMVSQGFNHPSIVLWGVFNEADQDFSANIRTMNNTVHSFDPSLLTTLAVSDWLPHDAIVDVVGKNYEGAETADPAYKVFNTEYFRSWNPACGRGMDCERDFTSRGWSAWSVIAQNQPRVAGGCLWVFADYFAWANNGVPMGTVDDYRIPKQIYYYFRQQFTGKSGDNPIAGTATKINLTADITTLQADGSDFSIITAAFRNSAGACIASTANVTFAASGPVTVFGPLTVPAAAGKCAILIRATTSTGAIAVTATSAGLPTSQISLTSVLPGQTSVIPIQRTPGYSVRSAFRNLLTIGNSGELSIFDLRGRTIGSPGGASARQLREGRAVSGIVILQVKNNSGLIVSRKASTIAIDK